jgi:hypothetical protein
MQCVNWIAGISYLHSKECTLVGSFWFTYCDDKERNNDKNIIFRCSFIGYFYLGFHIVITRKERVFIFAYDTKEKENQNTQKSD